LYECSNPLRGVGVLTISVGCAAEVFGVPHCPQNASFGLTSLPHFAHLIAVSSSQTIIASLMHLHLTFSDLVGILSLWGQQEPCPFTTRLRGLKLAYIAALYQRTL
jgi:hypothetical protein